MNFKNQILLLWLIINFFNLFQISKISSSESLQVDSVSLIPLEFLNHLQDYAIFFLLALFFLGYLFYRYKARMRSYLIKLRKELDRGSSLQIKLGEKLRSVVERSNSKIKKMKTELNENRNELHKVQQQLMEVDEQAHKFKSAIEHSANIIFLTDKKGSIEYVNKKFSEVTGYDASEVIGNDISILRSGNLPDSLYKKMWETINNGDEWRGEFHNKKKNGELYWVSASIAPIKTNSGKIQSFISVQEIITRQKNTIKALKESERRFVNLFREFLDTLIIVKPRDLKIILANRNVQSLFGYREDEIFGKPLGMLLTHKTEDILVPIIENIEQAAQLSETLKFRRKDKTLFYADVLTSVLHWENEPMVLLDIRDATARRDSIRALEKSERRLRRIFEQSSEAMVVIKNNKILRTNNRFVQLFNWQSDELKHEKIEFTDLVDPDFQKGISRIVVNNDLPERRVEFYGIAKTGARYLFDASFSNIDWEKTTAILCILRDITQENALKKQLMQSQKMEAIGQLAGGIAHDFNNIITAIDGYASLAQSKTRKMSATHKNLTEILKGSKRAANLTSQLLAFSRKQIIETKLVDINQVINDLNKMLCRLIGEDIEFKTILKDIPIYVKADVSQMEQIILNLIVNARDAINEKTDKASEKKIWIELSDYKIDEYFQKSHPEAVMGDYLKLAISDTGGGMDENTVSQIFNPFFTTKKLGHGTGLGLSTVYGIVKQNKAYIYVYSEIERGTTFYIYWPICKETPESEKVDTDVKQTKIVKNKRVLIVEDDEMVRSLAKEMLTSYGFKVEEAENGQRALDIVEKESSPFDLILSDVVMPVMGGKELVEKIVKILPQQSVLLSSGYTDTYLKDMKFINSNIHFIHKPYTLDELLQKVSELA